MLKKLQMLKKVYRIERLLKMLIQSSLKTEVNGF